MAKFSFKRAAQDRGPFDTASRWRDAVISVSTAIGWQRPGRAGALSGLLVLLWLGSWAPGHADGLPIAALHIGGQTLTVEIADTPAAKSRGLMFREQLPDDHGMLFIWPQEQMVAMWMKDTPVPLSVAFIADDYRILNIADMQPYSLRIHPSAGQARFALEVRQGWFARHGIGPGERLDGLEALQSDRDGQQLPDPHL